MLQMNVLKAEGGVALLEAISTKGEYLLARRFTLITAYQPKERIFDNFTAAQAAYEQELSRG